VVVAQRRSQSSITGAYCGNEWRTSSLLHWSNGGAILLRCQHQSWAEEPITPHGGSITLDAWKDLEPQSGSILFGTGRSLSSKRHYDFFRNGINPSEFGYVDSHRTKRCMSRDDDNPIRQQQPEVFVLSFPVLKITTAGNLPPCAGSRHGRLYRGTDSCSPSRHHGPGQHRQAVTQATGMLEISTTEHASEDLKFYAQTVSCHHLYAHCSDWHVCVCLACFAALGYA